MHLSSTLCVVRRLGRGKKESVWGSGMMERGERRQASAIFFVYIYQEHLLAPVFVRNSAPSLIHCMAEAPAFSLFHHLLHACHFLMTCYF